MKNKYHKYRFNQDNSQAPFLNLAVLSLVIGIILLYFNWMSAFGWLFIISTIVMGLVSMVLNKKLVKYRSFIVLISFLMIIIPIIILIYSIPNIKDSVEKTKENLGFDRESIERFYDDQPIPNSTQQESQEKQKEIIEIIYKDG